MDSQDSFVSRLPVTDDQKNALLYAFYNTLLFTLVFFTILIYFNLNFLVSWAFAWRVFLPSTKCSTCF